MDSMVVLQALGEMLPTALLLLLLMEIPYPFLVIANLLTSPVLKGGSAEGGRPEAAVVAAMVEGTAALVSPFLPLLAMVVGLALQTAQVACSVEAGPPQVPYHL